MCFWCERVKNPELFPYVPIPAPEMCEKEKAFRRELAAACKKFSDEPWDPSLILFNHDGTPTAAFWKEWGTIEPEAA
jgi:hypothetical protein